MVHHAGAGTAAAALLAGLPAVACPFHFDQFVWVGPVGSPTDSVASLAL